MAGNYTVPLYFVAGIACIVGALAIGFSFPPLTNINGGTTSSADREAEVQQELSYCLSNLNHVNCVCFARKAGQVLAYQRPEVRRVLYANRSDLARDQASKGC